MVQVLSIQHAPASIQRDAPFNPTTILDCNTNEDDVGVMDYMIGEYTVKYKSVWWYVACVLQHLGHKLPECLQVRAWSRIGSFVLRLPESISWPKSWLLRSFSKKERHQNEENVFCVPELLLNGIEWNQHRTCFFICIVLSIGLRSLKFNSRRYSHDRWLSRHNDTHRLRWRFQCLERGGNLEPTFPPKRSYFNKKRFEIELLTWRKYVWYARIWFALSKSGNF